jgi:predicted small metal-binding protein
MSKILHCAAPGCSTEVRGESEHDVLRKAAEHARTAHNMENIPPDMLSRIKGAIRDEGEARSQRAGTSN